MLAERFIASEVRETVVLQDHGSGLGSVGTVVIGAIDSAGSLDNFTGREIHLRRRETSDGVKHRANGRCQGLGLGKQCLDEMLVIGVWELSTSEQVIRT